MYWYETKEINPSAVLSTRVRFARNLDDVPFPALLSQKDKDKVFSRVKEALSGKELMAVSFADAEDTIKQTYVQTRLCSKEFAKSGGGLLLSREGDLSLMVCEEDHLRLQVIYAGKRIREAYECALGWAKEVENVLPIAYRSGLGYLTACPTNLGAALRLSVMIHLPALSRTGKINDLQSRLADAGFIIRGAFGEGSSQSGEIYQISNQMSREKTPEQIVSAFEKVIEQAEKWEKEAAEMLIKTDRVGEEDRVFRALGILKGARRMSYGEFVSHYSVLRFGRVTGLLETKGTEVLDRLFIELMPAPMLLRDQSLLSPEARDEKRSAVLREALQ